MRVETFENWSSNRTGVTTAGGGCGIAIGPESEEAIVRVNGVRLQAGRVLPLRASQYQIQREISLYDGIDRLQVVIFERPEEFAMDVARPNAAYDETYTDAGLAAHTLALTVPTVGRRQVHFTIAPDSDVTRYEVVGIILQKPASNGAGNDLHVQLVNNTAPGSGNVSFYLGGTNEAENWHLMELRLTLPASESAEIHVETIGEIGSY